MNVPTTTADVGITSVTIPSVVTTVSANLDTQTLETVPTVKVKHIFVGVVCAANDGIVHFDKVT